MVADFLAVAFLAVDFTVDLAADLVAEAFLATVFVADFFAGAFFAVDLAVDLAGVAFFAAFFAVDLAVDFAAVTFLAVLFFAVVFLAAALVVAFFVAVFGAVVFFAVVLSFLAGAFAVTFLVVLLAAGVAFFAADFVVVAFFAAVLLAVVLVAGAFLVAGFEAGDFFVALLVAPVAFLATLAVVRLVVLLAAPTALPAVDADVPFAVAVFFAGDAFAVDFVAFFCAAAGTCASWVRGVRRSPGGCRGRPVRSSPAYDLGNNTAQNGPIRETRKACRVASQAVLGIVGDPAVSENPLCTKGFRPRSVYWTQDIRVTMNLRQSGPFIGLAGMATTLFLYVWSAIVVHDAVTLVVLPIIWLVLLALSVAWFTTHPLRVLVLPFVAAAAWFWAMLA